MLSKNLFTKILAVTGTGLAWFPILATLVLSVVGSLAERRFLFDYLLLHDRFAPSRSPA